MDTELKNAVKAAGTKVQYDESAKRDHCQTAD